MKTPLPMPPFAGTGISSPAVAPQQNVVCDHAPNVAHPQDRSVAGRVGAHLCLNPRAVQPQPPTAPLVEDADRILAELREYVTCMFEPGSLAAPHMRHTFAGTVWSLIYPGRCVFKAAPQATAAAPAQLSEAPRAALAEVKRMTSVGPLVPPGRKPVPGEGWYNLVLRVNAFAAAALAGQPAPTEGREALRAATLEEAAQIAIMHGDGLDGEELAEAIRALAGSPAQQGQLGRKEAT